MLNVRSISNNRFSKAAAIFVFAFIIGFLLSDTKMAGVASFADISIAGALGLPAATAVFTGSLIHSILLGNVGKNIIKISSMILIVIIKMFFEPKEDPKMCGITTSVSIFISGAAVSAIIGEIFYKLIFYVFYGCLAGFAAYSLSLIVSGLNRRLVLDFSSINGGAYAIVYTLIMAALCSVSLPVINIGIIIGVFVTLLAAHRYRSSGGVLCGALTTCGAFLASQEYGMSVVLLPVAGLMTGYLSNRKYTSAAAFFLTVNFMLTVLSGITHDSIYTMIDLILGTALFVVISPYCSDRWVMTDNDFTSAMPEIMNKRMSFLSDSIEIVRNESEKISDILKNENAKSKKFGEESSEVCTNCYRRLSCWKNNYDQTIRGFRKLSRMSEISDENFPYELEECIHKSDLTDLAEVKLRENAMAKLLEMRFSESRRLLFEQIKIMEEIIESAGERLNVRYSESISKTVSRKLLKFGYNPKNVIAYYNFRNRLLIEIYFAFSDNPESGTRICDLISDELRVALSSAEPIYSGKEVRIRLFERPEYSLEVYGASMCAEGSGENGDTSLVFGDGTGVSYVILSDGMGSGKNAALESRMVVRMFKKLISSGVNYSSAVKLINSIMLAKSGEEAFATLDAVRVDLDDCNLTVIKSGASATLMRHRGSVMKIASSSFPIGIYEQSEIFIRNCECDEGDIIIMLSDGISENEYKFIRELLLKDSDVKKIVDEICAKSGIFNPASHNDDVTVIGMRIASSVKQ